MLAPRSFQNRKICILGLGRSGCASAFALQKTGAEVIGWDDDPDCRSRAVEKGIAVAKDTEHACLGVDVLLPAPGIPLTHPRPHPMVTAARNGGMEILGDLGLFQHVLDEQSGLADWIAVTGTNGKSTTACLVAHMLEKANFDVALGGNIGVPVMTLPEPRSRLIYVLEVSSFQIELADNLAPNIAVQLNIASDHLDRHGSLRVYAAVKAQLFAHLRNRDVAGETKQAAAVVGVDDEHGRALFARLQNQDNIRVIALALEEAVLPPALESVRVQEDKLFDGMKADKALHIHDLGAVRTLIGKHNRQNMAAAYAIGRLYGLSADRIIESFADFSPPPHRLERVAEIENVVFVNDSKATNPDAAARALECFDDIHWILGGIPKQDGIVGLFPLFPRIAHAYLFGAAKERFAATLRDAGVPHSCHDDLQTAVRIATRDAFARRCPVVVLLAPACASFDMFTDFEERGDRFRILVRELASHNRTNGADG